MSKKLFDYLVVKEQENKYLVTIWADINMGHIIRSVSGVAAAYPGQPTPTKYIVYLDPRYDVDSVLEDIKQALGG